MIEKEKLIFEGKSSYTAEIIACLFFVFCAVCGVYSGLTGESESLAVRCVFIAFFALVGLAFIFIPFSFKHIAISKEHLIIKYLVSNKVNLLSLNQILYLS